MPLRLPENSSLRDPRTGAIISEQQKFQDTIKKKKEECEAQGGKWDEYTQTCILPPQTKDIKVGSPAAPEVIKDEETGKVTGVKMPDGKVYQNLTPEDVKGLTENYTQKREVPVGAQEAGTARQLTEQQKRQQILSQLGQVTGVSQSELQDLIKKYGLDPTSQFREGAAGALYNAVPSALQTGATLGIGAAIIGGATTGAAGGPWGIVAGASAGVIFGLWRGLAAGQKAEAREDVNNAMAEFTQLRKGMSQVGTLASTGYINANEAVELYNAQLSRMLQIEAQIKYLQDTNLKDYLSDGSKDLATIQTYLAQVAPAYKLRIQTSLVNPTAKLPYSDIVLQDMAETANE